MERGGGGHDPSGAAGWGPAAEDGHASTKKVKGKKGPDDPGDDDPDSSDSSATRRKQRKAREKKKRGRSTGSTSSSDHKKTGGDEIKIGIFREWLSTMLGETR